MLVRLLAILSLVLVFVFVFAGSPLALHTQSRISLVACSPPTGLEVPVGQGVEIRCRVQGESEVTVEFRVNDELLRTERAPSNGIPSLSWAPAYAGVHTLEVVAQVEGGESVRFARSVLATHPGSPTRIH